MSLEGISVSSQPACSKPLPRFRRWTVKIAIVGIAGRFLFELIEYVSGRLGSHVSVFAIPAAIIPGLVLLLTSAALVVSGIYALLSLDWTRLGAAVIAVAIMWGSTVLGVLPDSFLVGYRQQILEAASFEEMRRVGQELEALEKRETNATGERHILLTKRAELWRAVAVPAKLRDATSNATVSSNGEYFAIINGSSLTGHWGVRVYYKGTPEKQPQDWKTWFSDERVAFFIEQD